MNIILYHNDLFILQFSEYKALYKYCFTKYNCFKDKISTFVYENKILYYLQSLKMQRISILVMQGKNTDLPITITKKYFTYMNDYKIGYYFHFPQNGRSNEELVLCLSQDKFRFFLVNCSLIPKKWIDKNSSYYDLSMPVLCKVKDEQVCEIRFLSDLSVDDKARSLIGIPMVDDNLTSNISDLYNNKEIELTMLLAKQVYARKKIFFLSETAYEITPNILESKRKKIIAKFKEHIDSFHINEILSSIQVRVWDYYKSKIGDDDTYYIYREAKILNDSIKVDNYIKEIIGLGEHCIYKDSGYTNQLKKYAKDFLETHPLGDYTDDILEKEKQRLCSMYSKEEHMAYLFFEQLNKQQETIKEIKQYEHIITEIEKKLKKDFMKEKLSSIDDRLFYDFGVRESHTSQLEQINKYILRLQSNLPVLKVIITGNTPVISEKSRCYYDINAGMTQNESVYFQKIGEIIEFLSKTNQIVLISGNANGAETLAVRYASKNKIECINGYTEWTMLGKDRKIDRAYKMVEKADLIIITGQYDYYITKNMLQAAKDLKKPVKVIEM